MILQERWAQMPANGGIIENRGKVVEIGGQRYEIPLVGFYQDGIDRLRLGRMCIVCYERFEVPYPERCVTCGFPVRRYQDEVFEKMYLGEMEIGPSTTLADEFEIAKDEVARQRREKQLKKSSIWLPRSIRD